MKRIGDFLVNTPSAAVVLAAAVILLVCALIPSLHSIAWILLLVAVLVAVLAVLGWSRTWTHLQDRIDDLQSSTADAYETYTPVTLTQTPQEELAQADSTAAQTIVSLLPEDDGLIRRLRIDAEMTVFPQDAVAPLQTFLADCSATRFDDPAAHRAFMDLYRAGRTLHDWIRKETETAEAAPGDRVLIPGDRRESGWKAFNEAKRTGERRADALLAARAEFSRVLLVSQILED
ncbi:MAG TPA: hypothetical protein K8V08_10310 [Brevibacterium senegalense]|uniref:Uncharacterized protein n=1 Tax=Brevibacterium senegalense TaxID=1033736 RepID=A0A921MEV1_9MICO|nr:hypothetical protein [Brevibacterium senegalense]